MMRAIDTSLLYAVFNDADAHHKEAVSALRQAAPLGIPVAVLQETLDLIGYRKGKPAAVAAYDFLAGLGHIRFFAAAPVDAVNKLWKANAPLSHADAGAIVAAWKEGAELLTADAKQRAVHRKGPR